MLIPMLAVVGLAEFGVRAVEDRMPPSLHFHSAEADIKLAQMSQLQAAGGVDLVLVGNSMVTAGLLPDVIEAGFDGRRTYNAGLAAAPPMLLEPWLREVVLPRLSPEIVVIGISTYDLADAEEGYTFLRAFEQSPGGKQVLGSEGIFDRADGWVADRSALWRNRQALRDPTNWKNAVFLGGPQLDLYTRAVHEDGSNRPSGDYRFDTRRSDNGPRVSDWAIGTDNRAALIRIIGDVAATGAQPVLVHMPVTGDHIDNHPGGPASLAAFRAELDVIAAETSVQLFDYEHPGTDYFADFVHLNAWGADAFSASLAADLAAALGSVVADEADGVTDGVDVSSGPSDTVTDGGSTPVPPSTVTNDVGADPPVVADIPDVLPDPVETPRQPPPVTSLPTLPPITLPPLPEASLGTS